MKFWGLELNFSLYCGFPFRCIALSESCRINLPFRNCTLSGLCFSVMWTVSWCVNAAWGVGEQWPASGCGRQAWQLWMLCRCLQTPSSTAEGKLSLGGLWKVCMLGLAAQDVVWVAFDLVSTCTRPGGGREKCPRSRSACLWERCSLAEQVPEARVWHLLSFASMRYLLEGASS